MLAATTTDGLSILDGPILKKCPPSFPSCLSLIYPPTSSAWSHDNTSLFISSAHTIHKYNSNTNSLRDIYTTSDEAKISQIAVKDNDSLFVAVDDNIHILEHGASSSSSEISQTFSTHKSPVLSFALSNDFTLLALTSSRAVHVHNLQPASGSHTVLNGLPLTETQTISTCCFHPHVRTRLLLGIGKQLVIYDTNRPSAPIKTISLNESSSGEIQAIGCSPFSKTLVAVATTGGSVGLVDLEKEKGLFRTLNVKVPLTSLSFSPEGASIYLGTENGKILIVDLRGLDKPPRVIVLSEVGSSVVGMVVQKKTKPAPSTTVTKATNSASNTVERKPSSVSSSNTIPKSRGTPAKPTRTVSGVSPSVSSRGPATLRKTASEAATKGTNEARKMFSPARSPLGSSHNVNKSLNKDGDKVDDLSDNKQRAKNKTSPTKQLYAQDREKRRERLEKITTTLSSAPSAGKTAVKSPLVASSASAKVTAGRNKEKEKEKSSTRTRTTSVSSASVSVSTRKASKSSITSSSSAAPSTSSSSGARTRSTSATSSGSVPPVPPLPKDLPRAESNTVTRDMGRARLVSGGTTVGTRTRTPSPDLPGVLNPVTPMPMKGMAGKRNRMKELGLGTPGLMGKRGGSDENGKGKGKNVEFDQDGSEGEEEDNRENEDEDDSGDDGEELLLSSSRSSSRQMNLKERKKQLQDEMNVDTNNMQMQVSPRRSIPASVSASGSPIPYSWMKQQAHGSGGISPARHGQSHLNPNHLSAGSPGHAGTASPQAQHFLRSIIQDILLDHHTQTRQEILGLHLDLVRMGSGWKKEVGEVKDLVEGLVGDVKVGNAIAGTGASVNGRMMMRDGREDGEQVRRLVAELREVKEENRRLKEENERLRMGMGAC
ncbi:WD40 repeat-like protein [Dendrothele bispora CBS 962.96]|uniref:WD40 repeat-like protein n=1 Tax=Dendrothele bispora (strain CBS 962.96) TaxID=1314807 RepID=A0A4S8MM75_DENBC|nr:WD40 repeat-like protein [Dendrothele bispora CBS 962.96]